MKRIDVESEDAEDSERDEKRKKEGTGVCSYQCFLGHSSLCLSFFIYLFLRIGNHSSQPRRAGLALCGQLPGNYLSSLLLLFHPLSLSLFPSFPLAFSHSLSVYLFLSLYIYIPTLSFTGWQYPNKTDSLEEDKRNETRWRRK